ncbi:hypothetical protein [Bradyrhizobium sp. Tv2a-2]|nr:hypothetical protein [Bradyrhizobium sp. Tv2a-2]
MRIRRSEKLIQDDANSYKFLGCSRAVRTDIGPAMIVIDEKTLC